jgi:hypothetical protein
VTTPALPWWARPWSPLFAVLVVYAMRALIAVALTWPFARIIADPALALAGGDRVLFADGAVYVAEVARLYTAELASLAVGQAVSWLLLAYCGLVPLAALIVVLSAEGRIGARRIADRALPSLGPLSLLLGLSVVAMAVAWVFPAAIFELVETKLTQRVGDVAGDAVKVGFRLIPLGSMLFVGIVHDLARVAVVRDELSAFSALGVAWSAIRERGAAALAGWSIRAGLGALLVLGAALAAPALGVESGARFAAVLVVHQAVALGLVSLRAHWLAHALRIVATVHDRRAREALV